MRKTYDSSGSESVAFAALLLDLLVLFVLGGGAWLLQAIAGRSEWFSLRLLETTWR